MMRLCLIAALARDRVIGFQGAMPWHAPAELQHFKAVTLGKPLVMGRKTFESIGRPLPGRRNIVVTRNPAFAREGVEAVCSLQEAISRARGSSEIMIAGGAQLYHEALPEAGRMYLSFLDLTVEGDTYFPEWDPREWVEVERRSRAADDRNPFSMTFAVLDRVGHNPTQG